MTNKIFDTAKEWKIDPTGVPNADHWMVAAKIINEESPEVGKGMWSVPRTSTKQQTITFIQKADKEAENKINKIKDRCKSVNNAQIIYAKPKSSITEMARRREKQIVPKITLQIPECKKKIQEIHGDNKILDREKAKETTRIVKEITSLERKQHEKRRENVFVMNKV